MPFWVFIWLIFYVAISVWMHDNVKNPPHAAYGVIFVGPGILFLLDLFELPYTAFTMYGLLAYMVALYVALIVVAITTINASPRTPFHVGASVLAWIMVAVPCLLFSLAKRG